MTVWNDRLLPYPLLAPWTDDYGEAVFLASVPHAVINNGANINVTIKYHLTSQTLQELVSNGQAQYASVIVCEKTFTRNTYVTNQEDDLQILNAGDYNSEMKLTPYIVSTQQIENLVSSEHIEEIKNIKPEGFDIPAGSILAVGDSTDITLDEGGSPYSVIDLVADHNIISGTFKVVLDDNRIKIHLSVADKNSLETLRQQQERKTDVQAIFFPAVYLHAVTEALRNLPDYQGMHWELTMRRALERHNITVEDDELVENAYFHAQVLMEKPIGTLLTVYTSKEEEE